MVVSMQAALGCPRYGRRGGDDLVVNIFPVAYSDNINNQFCIEDFVDNAITSCSDSIAIPSFQFFISNRTGVIS